MLLDSQLQSLKSLTWMRNILLKSTRVSLDDRGKVTCKIKKRTIFSTNEINKTITTLTLSFVTPTKDNIELITPISCCGCGEGRYDAFCWCNNALGGGCHEAAAVWGLSGGEETWRR